MPKRFKLYYSPGSFFSQKAQLALYEKNVDFDKVIINIRAEEQNQPWYLKINPKGQVPVLMDGDKKIVESDQIVNYIDSVIETGNRLVPDLTTAPGQAVDKWRKKLQEVPIETISYGIICNPELSVTGPKVSRFFLRIMRVTPEAVKAGHKSAIQSFREKAEQYPELREEYMSKIDVMVNFKSRCYNKDVVKQTLNDLETLMDEIETELAKTREENGTGAWLVSRTYTAADIHLTILLERLYTIGLEDRYWTGSRRPLIDDFFKRCKNRDSMIMIQKSLSESMYAMLKTKLWRALPFIFGIVAVGVSVGMFVSRSRK